MSYMFSVRVPCIFLLGYIESVYNVLQQLNFEIQPDENHRQFLERTAISTFLLHKIKFDVSQLKTLRGWQTMQ